jgi:hypothetical protein
LIWGWETFCWASYEATFLKNIKDASPKEINDSSTDANAFQDTQTYTHEKQAKGALAGLSQHNRARRHQCAEKQKRKTGREMI